MGGGLSSSQGILLYDDTKEESQAIYGYYDYDEYIVLEGTYGELKRILKQRDAPFKRNDQKKDHILYVLLIVMLIFLVGVFMLCSFLVFIACFVFSVISFVPILSLCYASVNLYDDQESYHQFRRYHATEHAMLNITEKKKEYTLDNIKKESIYERECGTVYSGNVIILAIVIMIVIMNIDSLSLLKSVGIVVGSLVILFINLWNPLNPLVFLQAKVIEKPTDQEYILAVKMLEKVKELDILS